MKRMNPKIDKFLEDGARQAPQSAWRRGSQKPNDKGHLVISHRKGTIMTTQSAQIKGENSPVAFGRGRGSLEQSVWYSGGLLTFLATGEDTQGQFALMELINRKGNVPPPHIHHREDETFYVIEGEMTFTIGERTIKATAGTMVFAPRDIAHSFTIDTDQARMLAQISPAGLEGFFKECSVPAPSMTLPPPTETPYSEKQKMMSLAPKYGFEFVLPKPPQK